MRHSPAEGPTIRAYGDAAELVADNEVTAVYIATPPGSHRELALLALARRLPCLVEKPLARNAAESAGSVAGCPLCPEAVAL